jgi:hypothetical protein
MLVLHGDVAMPWFDGGWHMGWMWLWRGRESSDSKFGIGVAAPGM